VANANHVAADRGQRRAQFLGLSRRALGAARPLGATRFERLSIARLLSPDHPRTFRSWATLRRAPGILAVAGAALRCRIARRRSLEPGKIGAALVVGGDACQQRFCETFLQTLGLTVEVAPNAQDGLRAAASAAYGLVIVDARTRGFDAGLWMQILEATTAKTASAAPDIYVVTNGAGDAPALAIELGASRSIQRPVRAVDLIRAVERMSR
jgi:CheY-like chemotaxis protein